FRLLFLTFYGAERLTPDAKHHLHESPPSMTVPLMMLATLSVVGGWVGLPIVAGGDRIKAWLAPSLAAGGPAPATAMQEAARGMAEKAAGFGVEGALMVLSVVVALVGIAVAWWFYLKNPKL